MTGHPKRLVDGIAAIVSGGPAPSTRSRRKAEQILDLIEEFVVENVAAAAAYADQVIAETGFAGIDVDGTGVTVNMRPPHEVVKALAVSMAEHLGDATNYGESSLSLDVHAAGDPHGFVVTVQRKEGKTPHELRRLAEAEAVRLRALIDRILDYSAFTRTQQVEYRTEAGIEEGP